ncbi:MAG TPA: hypothetical protein ENI23_00385 [bacterium]|nr:hypothetical protein [bacterium]
MCSACIELKAKYDLEGIKYKERDADRLKNPGNDVDDIDKMAFVQLASQNMSLPVTVDMEKR